MKANNEAKAAEQALVLQKWKENDCKGGWIAFTGTGKTRVGTLAACSNMSKLAAVIVPTESLRDKEWEQSFIDWGNPIGRANTEIACIQSAYKWKGRHFGVVVLDEVHTTLSDSYKLFFENNTYDAILWLTATEPEDPERLKYLLSKAPIIWRTPKERAIKLRLVSDSLVFNYGVELTKEERESYDVINKNYQLFENELGGSRIAYEQSNKYLKFQNVNKEGSNVRIYMPLYKIIKTSQIDNVSILASDCRLATVEELAVLRKRVYQSKMYWETLRQRKDVCHKAINKRHAAKEIYELYSERRTIIFSPLVEVANSVAELCGDSCTIYHAKVSKVDRKANLLDFAEGKKRAISSVKALNAGTDVEECDLALNLTNDSKKLNITQKNGRASRFKEGKIALFVNIYAISTQEAVWAQRGTYNMNPKWITTINELPKI